MTTRTLIPLLAAALALGACQREPPPAPRDFGADTVCTLDGMLVGDFPGPKGQIQYADGSTEFYCDVVEMVAMLLQPESARPVRAAYTQDMARATWDAPRGNWVDAHAAFFVVGSDARGSMGPTFATFAQRADAEAFARSHGGQVHPFTALTPDMADLRGGAGTDAGM